MENLADGVIMVGEAGTIQYLAHRYYMVDRFLVTGA